MGFRFLLDSGLHVAGDTEAPAARDVDDAAPVVTAKGRWAATSAASGRLNAAQAASASGLVMLCHSLLSRHLEKELMSPSSAQLGIERLLVLVCTSTGRP